MIETMTAQQSIDLSIRENRIVYINCDESTRLDLLVECEQHGPCPGAPDSEDFWGEQDGQHWRVVICTDPR